jgi:pantoate--beta-alanine ligase
VIVCRSRADLAVALKAMRARGHPIGLVPTMGYLHRGHGALIGRALRDGTAPVVSVFVNPLQFGPGEDFERYPRDEARDLGVAAAAGAEVVYMPSMDDLLPQTPRTIVNVPSLMDKMCARSRPGHFPGVALIVLRLIGTCRPDRAYFGEKDAQQLALVRQVAGDLALPVAIVGVATVRDPDGLALSSRNAYLSPAERTRALSLSRALRAGGALIDAGERDPARVRGAVLAALSAPGVEPEYAEVVEPDRLERPARLLGRTLIAVAARVGGTRLIDNLRLWVPAAGAALPLVDDPEEAQMRAAQEAVGARALDALRRRQAATPAAAAAILAAVRGAPRLDDVTLDALLATL